MDDMTFEQAFKKLDKYVLKLEKGELSLDESIKIYSEAMELSAFCSKKIEEAKLKISTIGAEND